MMVFPFQVGSAFATSRCDSKRTAKKTMSALTASASFLGMIGPTIIPKKLAEAVKADIVFLAVRFESHRDVAKALPTWKGKTIIDVTNAYGVSPEELDGLSSSAFVAKAFTGAKFVKGFNHL